MTVGVESSRQWVRGEGALASEWADDVDGASPNGLKLMKADAAEVDGGVVVFEVGECLGEVIFGPALRVGAYRVCGVEMAGEGGG